MDFGFRDHLPGQWITTDSSWVAAVRWQTSGRLEVRTRRGVILAYDGVPAWEWKRLLESSSKGRHMNHVIKPNYPFVG